MDRPTLERYELRDELGQGGMSVVYRARDAQLGRDVAVKILHRYLAKQAEARRRFHREAMAVARLRHRAIVEIYDYSGPDAEDAYIVCELIEGPTLRELVEATSAPGPELALLIGLELCEALAHAHGCGIIHRDLKPENVMITPSGQLKLMDFGIAQVLEGNTRLTATGTLVGSPAHMAPEVIDGKESDHRSDLFSLGTLLYWLAVGELPFTAPHPSALFKRILDGTYTPADAVCPKVGRRAARIIDRCLATSADDRPASADALAAEIRTELEYVGLDASGVGLRRFLCDPAGERANVDRALVAALITRAREALDERAWGRASDAVNRILAREPDHAEARAILERLARGERRTAVLRRGAAALVPAGLAAAVLAIGIDRGDTEPPRADAAQRAGSAPPRTADGAPPGEGPAPPAAGRSRPQPNAAVEPPVDPTPTAAIPERRPPSPAEPTTPRPTRPSASDTRRRPAPDAADEAAPVEAELVIQIGRGYADVWVDDRLVLDLAFRGRVQLAPGRHAVRVVRDREKILARLGLDEVPLDRPFPQFGRFAPRTVEVDETGRIFELGPGGPVELKDGVLRFSIPTTPQQAERNVGWISS